MPDRPGFEHKIVARADLAARAGALARPIVLTNGVFDILHRGHVTYLDRARALGATLVVAVNSDHSVRQLGKGDDRPINAQDDRAAVLAALESVSLVTLFDETVPLPVLESSGPRSMPRAATTTWIAFRKRNWHAPGARSLLRSRSNTSARRRPC